MRFYKAAIATTFVALFLSLCQLNAQDITVYTSSFSMDSTISRIRTSIKNNEYKYLKIEEFQSVSDSTSKFSGLVKVIHFETPEIYQLAACEPTVMMDMPLKIVTWSEDGDTYFGFMNANTYKKRFMIRECDILLRKINKILIRVANDVIRTR